MYPARSDKPFSFRPALIAMIVGVFVLSGCSMMGSKSEDDEPDAPQQAELSPDALNYEPQGLKKWLSAVSPYKRGVQQGNFVSSEMLAKAKPGMTREQIRYILGTPLLKDMFHENRWDYIFRLQKPNGSLTTNRVTVYFNKEGVAERILNDQLPTESEYLSRISSDGGKDDKKPKKRKQADDTPSEGGNAGMTEQRLPKKPAGPSTLDAPVDAVQTGGSMVVKSTNTEGMEVQELRQAPAQQHSVVPDVSPPGSTAAAVAPPQPKYDTVRTAQPIPVAQPVSAYPDVKTPAPKRVRRRIAAKQIDFGEDKDNNENKLQSIESISTTRRIDRMSPEPPTDDLIGNVQ